MPSTSPSPVMPLMVRPRNTAGNYVAADPVTLIQREFGCERSTAAQMLKFGDERNPVPKLTRIVGALNAGGRGDVADKILIPLDITRYHVRVTLTPDLIADAQRTDLLEDIAENEARSFPTLESKRRWLRALEAEHAKDAEEIAGLRADIANG